MLRTFFLVAAVLQGTAVAQGADGMISYTCKPERPVFTSGDDITVHLQVVNQGDTPLTIARLEQGGVNSPRFRITGPGYPEGLDIPRAMETAEVPQDSVSGFGPAPWRIMAGDKDLETVSLSGHADFSRPGQYRVDSTLDVAGTRLTSDTAEFSVVGFNPAEIHVGQGVSGLGFAEGNGVLLNSLETETLLHRFRFIEADPNLQELDADRLTEAYTVGTGARDAMTPVSNGSVFADLVQWVFWREGRQLNALASTNSTATFALPEEPGLMVTPPLKDQGGPIDVLALSGDRTRLWLVRFELDASPLVLNPVLKWESVLPGAAKQASAAIGSPDHGSDRLVAFAQEADGGVALFLGRYKNGPPEFVSHVFDNAELIPSSGPGVFQDPEGAVHVGLVVRRKPDDLAAEHQLVLLEMVVSANSSLPRTSEAVLAGVSDPPDAAVVFYQRAPEPGAQRRVLAQFPEGLFSFDGEAAGRPLSLFDTPVQPLQLVAGSSGNTYVLTISEDGRVSFQPL